MAKQTISLFFIAGLAQILFNTLSMAHPIHSDFHKRALAERCYGDECGYGGYGYDGFGYGGCDCPYVSSFNTADNNANQDCCDQAYENCDDLTASICDDLDTAFCDDQDNACNSNNDNSFLITKRGLQERCDDGYDYDRCESPCGGHRHHGHRHGGYGHGHECGHGRDYGCDHGFADDDSGFSGIGYLKKRDIVNEKRCDGGFGYGSFGYGGPGCDGFGCDGLGYGGYGYGYGDLGYGDLGYNGFGYDDSGYDDFGCDGLGYLGERSLSHDKRCGLGYGDLGYGGDLGYSGDLGYGDGLCYGGDACAPFVSSYGSASNSDNQACCDQAYENSNHLTASICQDSDTAYSSNNAHACNSNDCNSDTVVV